ncbi:hypothetical protein BJY52DRAFT_614119 [Lactarius psammicola]|nr:hypothetical protein BJY52DRAFT_614119 [Lactarius psammicola]
MAKTNCRPIAGPSSSTRLCAFLILSLPPPSNPLGHSPRSRRRRSTPSIVALLATISASPPSVHAHPLDPPGTALPFLYPPSIHKPTPPVAKRSIPPSSDATTNTPPPTPPSCNQERSNLPDKYVLGDDGYWHKTKWSLYGSSQCPGSCPPPSAVQDADTRNGSTVTLLPSPTIDDFDVSSLPTGWNTPNNASRQGTVIILSLSVALAVVILAMMITCVIWRRKLIPKKDPEKKWRQSSDFDDSSRSIREAKAAQRRWTNAVSRWRSNVRFSARRRRTDRTIARTSYSTLGREGEGIITRPNSPSSSRSPSPTPTVRSRASTNQDVPTSSAVSDHSAASRAQAQSSRASSPQPQVTSPYSLPSHTASPIQPPAYHPQPPVPPPPPTGDHSDHSPPYTHSDCCSSGPSKPPLSSCSPRPNAGDDGHLDSLSGHVATDDKALLSRRAAFVSAPPGSSSHLPPSASVPPMEDDDDFELPSESRPSSPIRDAYDSEQRPPYLPPASLLPPPPSKGKLKYDYSRDLDLDLNYDIATVEPGLGPSAPPFEESEAVPSAPPLDLDVPVPSAPVMVAEPEDDRQDDVHRMDTGAVMGSPGHVSPTLPGEHVVDGATPDTASPLPRR